MASNVPIHPADTEAQIDLLRGKIRDSEFLQSLLFDIDLLPEQIKAGDLRRWAYVQAIIGHIEELQRDGERYRKLRNQTGEQAVFISERSPARFIVRLTFEYADAAVDALK